MTSVHAASLFLSKPFLAEVTHGFNFFLSFFFFIFPFLFAAVQPMAVEVFSADGRNYLLAFQKGVRNKVYQRC